MRIIYIRDQGYEDNVKWGIWIWGEYNSEIKNMNIT